MVWVTVAGLTGRLTVRNEVDGKTTDRRAATRLVTRSTTDESRTARASGNVT